MKIIHNKEEREAIKSWFQLAKQYKCIHVLYKTDNILRNTPGYHQHGFFKYVKIIKLNGGTSMNTYLNYFKKRFGENSLKETTQIDYWFHNIKTKVNFNNYDYD